jgi:hypothetical protein
MKAILLELGGSGNFERPKGITEAIVCDESGKLPGRFCKNLAIRPMREQVSPSDTCKTHVTIVSDQRTGRIATSLTPMEHRTSTNYLSLPPIYDAWMVENGFARPPKELNLSDTNSSTLEVLFPIDGSVFQMDPVLRASYQRLSLRGAVSTGVVGPEWWIDDIRYSTADSASEWVVQPGWHSIEIRGFSADGNSVKSEPSRIFVGSIDTSVGPETIDAASNNGLHPDP